MGGALRGGRIRGAGGRRLGGSSHLRASPQEVAALEALYREGHRGWNVRHFHDEVHVAEEGDRVPAAWVKSRLREAKLVR